MNPISPPAWQLCYCILLTMTYKTETSQRRLCKRVDRIGVPLVRSQARDILGGENIRRPIPLGDRGFLACFQSVVNERQGAAGVQERRRQVGGRAERYKSEETCHLWSFTTILGRSDLTM